MLQLSEVTKRFGGVVATDGVTLDVAQGEVHALIGPNGAGKTTLVGQISGSLATDSGKIVLEKADITAWREHQRVKLGLARSYQITSIFKRFSVLDNLALAVQARSGSSFSFWRPVAAEAALFDEARGIADQVGLAKKAGALAATLAHGEQRALEVGLALATRPRLVLLDEPMAGMNLEEKQDMCRFVLDVNDQFGTTLVLIEHDMGVVMDISDRVVVLDYGRKIADGAPEEVRNDQKVIDAYLGVAH